MTSRHEQLKTTFLDSSSMRTMNSLDMPSKQSTSIVWPKSRARRLQVMAPTLNRCASFLGFTFSFFLAPRVMKLNLTAESIVAVLTKFSARSFRYSCRVRVAMALNFSDLCAAFSPLMTLASRKSLKTADFGKVTDLGIGGPKGGTSLDLDTATLKERESINQIYWWQ